MSIDGEIGNPVLKAMILEVVENQMREGDPPETKQTYERLISEGHSETNAKRLVGCVVASEMFDIFKNQAAFNPERFVKALNDLPDLSDD